MNEEKYNAEREMLIIEPSSYAFAKKQLNIELIIFIKAIFIFVGIQSDTKQPKKFFK